MKNYREIAALFLASIWLFAFSVASQEPTLQRVEGTPTPTPIITPTPTATPSSTPAGQTLADLKSKIRFGLSRYELRRGHIGVKIASLNSGKVIYEEWAEKYFMPASNIKNFTVAAALEALSPNYRFVTSVYAPAQPIVDGVIKGDLRIYGRGDISISYTFNNGDYHKGLDDLADKIVQAGVKRVEGNLVGDESYFLGNAIPLSWEWDDLQWYYGAEISALPVNDNVVDLSVRPSSVGAFCSVVLSPANQVMQIVNRCTTTAAGVRRSLRITKKLDRNILEISGTLPVGDQGFKNFVTVSHPAELFVALLRQRLEQKGIVITGQTRTESVKYANAAIQLAEIAKLESPPFSVIAARTMKPSQNMYTEIILWTLGEQTRPPGNTTSESADLGIAAVKRFLTTAGIAGDGIIQHDGSGLSRHNLVTPSSVMRLYTYMAKQSRYASVWRESLTIGGVDGTLQNRFRNTPAASNVRGKTGTIDQVSALSGYVTTALGEQLVFSIIVNGVAEPGIRRAVIDEIVVNLANFNGKVD